jgi:predicted histidine transporter YuiF (NhaC family)
MAWVVIVSVLVMTVLSLFRVNVILAIIAAALTAGVMAGLSVAESVDMLVAGMGGQSNTALSYILLGAFAVAISYSGVTGILVNFIIRTLTGRKTMMLLALAGIAVLAENLVPVHIAFIPILIPPLLKLFDDMRLDRRAVAVSLTFGLKAAYITIPAGFGLIFQNILLDGMVQNGADFTLNEVTLAMLIPGAGMIVGLLFAIFISYRKDRLPVPEAGGGEVSIEPPEVKDVTFNRNHLFTLVAIVIAVVVQITSQNLVASAMMGLAIMFITRAVPFKKGDNIVANGVSMMGVIAFVMLVASGYGNILKEVGAVDALVEASSGFLAESSQMTIAFMLLLFGLIITIGIGSSFGTIPIIAALYVPLSMAAGFSPMATAILIGTAGALGDAGSPASDSTLGPTAGLNADGNHNHIWDTCVPTFLHFNIPLFLFGWIGALIF